MLLSFFAHRQSHAGKSLAGKSHSGKPTWAEADVLETRHGHAGAIRYVREQIAHADRSHRRHLYELHDELARRDEHGRRFG